MGQQLDIFRPRTEPPLRALTLWRPWPYAILYGGKRIENRPWKPGASVLGQQIALHSGQHYDAKRSPFIAHLTGRTWGPHDVPAGCIVGVATVVGYFTAHRRVVVSGYTVPEHAALLAHPWYMAPQVGWLLENVRPVAQIPCRGGVKLWTVPEDVAIRVRHYLRTAQDTTLTTP